MGPSGCGKSTVVQLLLRFYEVSGGAVVVDGVDARTLDVATLRSKMGLVAQEPVLFTGTIFENIARSCVKIKFPAPHAIDTTLPP